MGNLGQKGDYYDTYTPIIDLVTSLLAKRKRREPKAPRPPRQRAESPWSGLGEAVQDHNYDIGDTGIGTGQGSGRNETPRQREDNSGDRGGATLRPVERPPINVENKKGTAGQFSDSLFAVNEDSQADSGSGMGSGDEVLSDRNKGRQEGVWETHNGPFPELTKDDPRPVWHPGRSEAWIDNAQGYHENQDKPLETDFILQAFLADSGYNPGEVDGYFGPKSKKALEDFQRDRGLEITGTMNAETRGVIKTAASEHGDDSLWR